MAAAKMVGIVLALLRILGGRRRVDVFLEAKQMRRMEREVPDEMVIGDGKPAHDFGQINPLPDGHLFASFHLTASARSLVAAGFQRCWQQHHRKTRKIEGLQTPTIRSPQNCSQVASSNPSPVISRERLGEGSADQSHRNARLPIDSVLASIAMSTVQT